MLPSVDLKPFISRHSISTNLVFECQISWLHKVPVDALVCRVLDVNVVPHFGVVLYPARVVDKSVADVLDQAVVARLPDLQKHVRMSLVGIVAASRGICLQRLSLPVTQRPVSRHSQWNLPSRKVSPSRRTSPSTRQCPSSTE